MRLRSIFDCHRTQQNPTPMNTTELTPATNRVLNLTDADVNEISSFYAVSKDFGARNFGNFFLDGFTAYATAGGLFGESGIFGSERLVGRFFSNKFGGKRVWIYRFNAGCESVLSCACDLTIDHVPDAVVGTDYGNSTYPGLGIAPHAADNGYLSEPLNSMTNFERALAMEFRAYLGSFIRTGDPNKQKLATSPDWPCYAALGDFIRSPIRLLLRFAFSSNANKTLPTSTEVEVAALAGSQREDYWQSERLLDITRL